MDNEQKIVTIVALTLILTFGFMIYRGVVDGDQRAKDFKRWNLQYNHWQQIKDKPFSPLEGEVEA